MEIFDQVLPPLNFNFEDYVIMFIDFDSKFIPLDIAM